MIFYFNIRRKPTLIRYESHQNYRQNFLFQKNDMFFLFQMVSRKKILSRSRDDLDNISDQEEEKPFTAR